MHPQPRKILALIPFWLVVSMLLCILPACSLRPTRTVYVRDTDPVRLAKTVKKASVWVAGKDGVPVLSTVDLDEGKYVISDPAPSKAAVVEPVKK